MDTLTPEARGRLMAKIRSKHTMPELRVRSLLHRLGFRFSLHRRDLPGTPDIVLPARGAVVFVNGCFWHGHACRMAKIPKTRTGYWRKKIEANQQRDVRDRRRLRKLGWLVICVRECELKNIVKLRGKLVKAFLQAEDHRLGNR